LEKDLLCGPDDPLFPPSKCERGSNGYFESVGFARTHWKSAAAIRAIFRKAFQRAGLPYSNPHVIRHTLTLLGETQCYSAEDFKAWSQNLGHDNVLTTLTSYGQLTQHRQDEILERMARDAAGPSRKRDADSERLDRLEQIIDQLRSERS
jgi:integrase/recombinase XerD